VKLWTLENTTQVEFGDGELLHDQRLNDHHILTTTVLTRLFQKVRQDDGCAMRLGCGEGWTIAGNGAGWRTDDQDTTGRDTLGTGQAEKYQETDKEHGGR
jgi:hypothetical protein